MDWIWNILQIEPTIERREIKRAYARRSKEIHPEEKPDEFQNLYEAYQRALQYASRAENAVQREHWYAVSEEDAAGKVAEYEELGFYSEEMQNERLRIAEIRYFQDFWNRQISEREQGREFLAGEWKAYLESKRFQELMWSPLVMETIASGMMKYFQWKKDVLLYFFELYGFGIFEKWGEENFEDENLQRLYKSLYPVCKKNIQQQRIQSIEEFLKNWETQMIVWKTGGGFLSEWKAYLLSEDFREIMWSSSVLKAIAEGMRRNFPRKEEMSLFFWELYGFEESEEEKYKGRSLQLYRVLHEPYTNYIKRQKYRENRREIQRENRKHIYRKVMIAICILLAFFILIFINYDVTVGIAAIILVPLFIYYFCRWFLGV